MIQALQRLCGVVLLTVITVGQTWGTETIDIRLQTGTALEERGREQLRRLLRTYDLHKWLFTGNVVIQSGAIPHSHPVLTLNTRYLDDDTAQLATFLHEQLHWFLTDHVERAKINAVLTELRAVYPTVPSALPEGAGGEGGTYLHLIVCYLELQAVTALLGEQNARQRLESWTHYTWVYRTVLTDSQWIGELLRRDGVVVPERSESRTE